MLLFLRISVAESGMFKQVRDSKVVRGNFLMFFTNARRFRKYLLAILIGLPTWYVIGILVNLSNRPAGPSCMPMQLSPLAIYWLDL